jgi:hypothetical protein
MGGGFPVTALKGLWRGHITRLGSAVARQRRRPDEQIKWSLGATTRHRPVRRRPPRLAKMPSPFARVSVSGISIFFRRSAIPSSLISFVEVDH